MTQGRATRRHRSRHDLGLWLTDMTITESLVSADMARPVASVSAAGGADPGMTLGPLRHRTDTGGELLRSVNASDVQSQIITRLPSMQREQLLTPHCAQINRYLQPLLGCQRSS